MWPENRTCNSNAVPRKHGKLCLNALNWFSFIIVTLYLFALKLKFQLSVSWSVLQIPPNNQLTLRARHLSRLSSASLKIFFLLPFCVKGVTETRIVMSWLDDVISFSLLLPFFYTQHVLARLALVAVCQPQHWRSFINRVVAFRSSPQISPLSVSVAASGVDENYAFGDNFYAVFGLSLIRCMHTGSATLF